MKWRRGVQVALQGICREVSQFQMIRALLMDHRLRRQVAEAQRPNTRRFDKQMGAQ
jgi:hypothetical protein